MLLTWRIGWAPNNASRSQMGFNLEFKGLNVTDCLFKQLVARNTPGALPGELPGIVKYWEFYRILHVHIWQYVWSPLLILKPHCQNCVPNAKYQYTCSRVSMFVKQCDQYFELQSSPVLTPLCSDKSGWISPIQINQPTRCNNFSSLPFVV